MRVDIYMSGIILKKLRFIIEIGIIIFQHVLLEDQYTFACVETNFQRTFSIEVTSNTSALNVSTNVENH